MSVRLESILEDQGGLVATDITMGEAMQDIDGPSGLLGEEDVLGTTMEVNDISLGTVAMENSAAFAEMCYGRVNEHGEVDLGEHAEDPLDPNVNTDIPLDQEVASLVQMSDFDLDIDSWLGPPGSNELSSGSALQFAASSSSSSSAASSKSTPGVPSVSSISGSSSSSSNPPVSDGASVTDTTDWLAGVTWSVPTGKQPHLVMRGGKVLGHLTAWGNSVGCKCNLHTGCKKPAPANQVERLVRWLVRGEELPIHATDKERQKARNNHIDLAK
jgi:hypothetical protein